MSLFSNICTWALHTAIDAGKKAAIQEVQQAAVQLMTVVKQKSSDLPSLAQPAINELADVIKKNAPQLAVLAVSPMNQLKSAVDASAKGAVNLPKFAQSCVDEAVSHAIAGILTKA